VLTFVATIIAISVATNIWVRVRFGGALFPGHIAIDALGLQAMWRSPSYLLMVAVILFLAGWLLKHWLKAN